MIHGKDYTVADAIRDGEKRKITKKEKKAIQSKESVNGVDPEFVDEKRRVPHITEFEDLIDVLPDLAIEARAIAAKLAPLEARKKEIAEEIKLYLDAVKQTSIRGDNWVAVRTKDTEVESLSPELLVKEGVTLDQIAAAIVKNPKAGYVQVREWKPRKGESE